MAGFEVTPEGIAYLPEFAQLDAAINDLSGRGEIDKLVTLAHDLEPVAQGQQPVISGFLGLNPDATNHFAQHWVGDDETGTPPSYWPYAWGRDPEVRNERVLIDQLLANGMMQSIRKVTEATNPRPVHITIWVCHRPLSDDDERMAYSDKDFRTSLFKVGVVQARDAIALVIATPAPEPLVAGPD
jgi:hypothetical protein